MTIRAKLALTVIVAMGLVCFMALVFYKSRALETRTRQTLQEATTEVALLKDLIQNIERQFARADYFLITLDPKEAEEFESLKRTSSRKLEEVGWVPFERELAHAGAAAESLFALQKNSKTRMLSAVMTETYTKFTAKLRETMREHVELVAKQAEDRQRRAQGELKKFNILYGILLVVASCALIVLNIVIYRSIAKPLAALEQGIAQLGFGVKRGGFVHLNSRDEFGAVARAFNSMIFKLQELDKLKEEFVASATHELRSPLSAGQSFVKLLLQDMKALTPQTKLDAADIGRWQNFLERLKTNLDRLNNFISDMLEIAKIERGKLECHIKETDLAPLIEETVEFFKQRARDKGVLLEARLQKELPPCKADADRVRQVLVNLIDNAIKFTRRGAQASVSAEAADSQWLKIAVADQGPGLAFAGRQKIFEKFGQNMASYQFAEGAKGTGLGLSISKAIVELHGGKIWVDSQPGEGCVFSFTLPLVT